MPTYGFHTQNVRYKVNALVDDRLFVIFLAVYYSYTESSFKIVSRNEGAVVFKILAEPIPIDAIDRKVKYN